MLLCTCRDSVEKATSYRKIRTTHIRCTKLLPAVQSKLSNNTSSMTFTCRNLHFSAVGVSLGFLVVMPFLSLVDSGYSGLILIYVAGGFAFFYFHRGKATIKSKELATLGLAALIASGVLVQTLYYFFFASKTTATSFTTSTTNQITGATAVVGNVSAPGANVRLALCLLTYGLTLLLCFLFRILTRRETANKTAAALILAFLGASLIELGLNSALLFSGTAAFFTAGPLLFRFDLFPRAQILVPLLSLALLTALIFAFRRIPWFSKWFRSPGWAQTSKSIISEDLGAGQETWKRSFSVGSERRRETDEDETGSRGRASRSGSSTEKDGSSEDLSE